MSSTKYLVKGEQPVEFHFESTPGMLACSPEVFEKVIELAAKSFKQSLREERTRRVEVCESSPA